MAGPEKIPNAIEREVLKRGRGLQGRMNLEEVVYFNEAPAVAEQVEPFRNLFFFDDRLKCSPEGDVWILSYPPITKPVTEDMFPDLPPAKKPRKFVQRRWSNAEDIEKAIRMAGHVADAYEKGQGEAAQNTLGVVDLVKNLSYGYQREGITDEGREELAQETADTLVATKYANARKPEKVKIKNMLLAAGQKDVLQRINPSRSRMIISNAWIDLSRELIVNRIIGEKYRTMEWRLRQERDFERFCLEQTAARIDEIGMVREGSPESKRLLHELEVFVYRYNSSEYVKAKPYSKVAAISRFLMFGDGQQAVFDDNGRIDRGELNDDLTLLAKYIGKEDAQLYWGTPKFKGLKPNEKMTRLRTIAASIRQTLEEGDINLEKAAV